MRNIAKSAEPRSLVTRRAAVAADDPRGYEDYMGKDEVRAALLVEQKALCCYCMGRIVNDALKMKIEHWRCRDRYRNFQLDYGNFLALASAGKGDRRMSNTAIRRKLATISNGTPRTLFTL